MHARGKPISTAGDETWESDALLHRVAELTVGYSGAELANLLNEAAILMVRPRTVDNVGRMFLLVPFIQCL